MSLLGTQVILLILSFSSSCRIVAVFSSCRFMFQPAMEHVYALMKKDSYTRFIRSEEYNILMQGAQSLFTKKRFVILHLFVKLWDYRTENGYLNHLMTKPTKWHVRPAKTQISLGIPPVWSESSLSA